MRNNKLAVVLVLASAGLAVGLVRAHVQLAAARAENIALRGQLAGITSSPDPAAAVPSGLGRHQESASSAPRADAPVSRPPLATRTVAPGSGSRADSDSDQTETGRRGDRGREFQQRFAKMMQDPQLRQAMLERQKFALNREYGALFQNLQLSTADQDKLTTLLAERRSAAMQGGDEQEDAEARAARVDQRRAEIDLEIQQLLGDERYAELETYQATSSERRQVERLNEHLSQKAVALDAAQQEEVITLLMQERLNAGVAATATGRGAWRRNISAAEADQLVRSQAEVNQRVYENSAEFLTPAQRAELKSYQDNNLAMLKLRLQVMAPASDPSRAP